MTTNLQNLDTLTETFGNSQVAFQQVAPGLVKAVLRFAEQAVAEIHLQGAHLTRWIDTLGRENIFNSPSAVYQAGVPIRGGNPIIFPQFGPGEICQHGFARNCVWQVLSSAISAQATTLRLQLTPAHIKDKYRQQWGHDFRLVLTISLAETLVTQMQIYNPNPYPLSFTHGFHTYLAVDDVQGVEISGLTGLDYMDNLRNHNVFSEQRQQVTITEFIDRRYQGIPAEIFIKDNSSGRLILMRIENCADAFVWNPWQEAEKKLADLAPQSYQRFICVEPGNMKNAIVLQAGQSFISKQEIQRMDVG
jgi:glucose-6-phosphate 1-epimerase